MDLKERLDSGNELDGTEVMLLLARLPQMAADVSHDEESCLEIAKSTLLLIRSYGSLLVFQAYRRPDQMAQWIAPCVVMLLDMIRHSSKALNSSALDALEAILALFTSFPDILAAMLPGVVSGLAACVLDSPLLQSHRIIAHALRLFTFVVENTLCDTVSAEFILVSPDGCSAVSTAVLIDKMQSFYTIGKTNNLESIPDDVVQKRFIRTFDWFKKATDKISIICGKFQKLSMHDHADVRDAISFMATSFIKTCAVSLSACTGVCLDILVMAVARDEQIGGGSALWKSLCKQIDNSFDLTAAASDRFDDIASNLPATLGSVASDHASVLKLASGYISLLRNHASAVLNSHIICLAKALVKLLVFDVERVSIVEERASSLGAGLARVVSLNHSAALAESTNLTAPRRRLRYLSDEVLDQTRFFCQLSAFYGDASSFINHLTVRYLHKTGSQHAAIFIITEMCRGINGKFLYPIIAGPTTPLNDSANIVAFAFSEFLRLDVLLPSNAFENKIINPATALQEDPAMNQLNHAALSQSLVLEGFGEIAKLLAPEEANLFLMDGLYLLLEKLGDKNYLVSESASFALQQFARICIATKDARLDCAENKPLPETTVANLVLSNADYLVDSISKRLRYIDEFPIAPKVMAVLIRVSGPAIVGPLLRDCIDDCIDILNERGTSSFMQQRELLDVTEHSFSTENRGVDIIGDIIDIFLVLTETMDRNAASDSIRFTESVDKQLLDADVQCTNEKLGIPTCSPEIRDYYLSRRRDDKEVPEFDNLSLKEDRNLSAEEFFNRRIKDEQLNETSLEEDAEDANAVLPSNEPKEPDATVFEAMSLLVLKTSWHYLSYDDPRVRAKVLSILRSGMYLLKNRPNDLNPMIHTVWSKVLLRCSDDSCYVVLEAICVLIAITETSPDFVRKRVSDDVIPRLIKVLRSLISEAHNAFQQKQRATCSFAVDVSKFNHNMLSSIVPTTQMQNRLFDACLSLLDLIISRVPTYASDQDKLSKVLLLLLDARLFSKSLQQKVLCIIRTFLIKGNSDWVWLLCCAVLGTRYISFNNKDYNDICNLKDITIPPEFCESVSQMSLNRDPETVINLCKVLSFSSGNKSVTLEPNWNCFDDGIATLIQCAQ